MSVSQQDQKLAEMILESLASSLSILPARTFEDAEGIVSPTFIKAVKAAKAAFDAMVTMDDIQQLQNKLFNEVRSGLAELDAKRES